MGIFNFDRNTMDVQNIASVEDARELLRSWREDVVRRSDDVVGIWEEILMDTQADLGDERWMILEQVAVAAMDVYRRDIVTDCLKELRANFDRDSFRVRRLEAMRAEMLEDWDLALEILDQILEEDDSNSQARKRKYKRYILLRRADITKYSKPFVLAEIRRN